MTKSHGGKMTQSRDRIGGVGTAVEGPDPIDIVVGYNIRRARKQRRLTQGKLAASVGLTFQQIQKYERGANRVSASKLCRIAAVLDMSPCSLLPEDGVQAREPSRQDLARVAGLDEMIEDYGRLSPFHQGVIRRLLHDLASAPRTASDGQAA